MNIVKLSIEQIHASPWNPNEMDEEMTSRLRRSIQRFGLVAPLVVWRTEDGHYETIGGAQRLSVLREVGEASIPCVVVEADDAEARLLSQALNHISGADNLGLRAELIRHLLDVLPPEEVHAILPDIEELQALSSLAQEPVAEYLAEWERARSARLRHLQFQLTETQLEIIEEALSRVLPLARRNTGDSPNARGTALYELCRAYLELSGATL